MYAKGNVFEHEVIMYEGMLKSDASILLYLSHNWNIYFIGTFDTSYFYSVILYIYFSTITAVHTLLPSSR
jgi:hypothetical protein